MPWRAPSRTGGKDLAKVVSPPRDGVRPRRRGRTRHLRRSPEVARPQAAIPTSSPGKARFRAEVIVPFLAAYRATPTLSPKTPHSSAALLPIECRNFHYLVLRPDRQGRPWLVYFEFIDDRPYVVGSRHRRVTRGCIKQTLPPADTTSWLTPPPTTSPSTKPSMVLTLPQPVIERAAAPARHPGVAEIPHPLLRGSGGCGHRPRRFHRMGPRLRRRFPPNPHDGVRRAPPPVGELRPSVRAPHRPRHGHLLLDGARRAPRRRPSECSTPTSA